jgi:SagB-type dehydrogenase family enzyme
VEDEKIELLLEAARWAPSAGNLQSVEYIIVKNKETREKLAKAAYNQGQIIEAPVSIVVCCNMRKISPYGARGKELYTLQESGACIQNLMLEAYSLGLGTCWIGAFDEAKVKEILKISDYTRPVAIITVGYPNEKPKSSRKDIKHSVFFEFYGKW